MNLREGGTLARDRYRLRSRIAVGGMGEIWRAYDSYTRRDVAIKVLRPEFKGNSDFLQRLRIEALNTQSLKHPNIAELYGHGEEDGSGYLVMELVPGESLSERLDREGLLPLRETLEILAQTAHGLHAAHEAGIIHRDVKPGNILLSGDRVKITDFGISLSAGQAPITATGMVMGTAQYLPPEQALGKPATPAGDVYALGIVAYETLVGHRPFTGETEVDIALAHVREPVPPMPETIDADVAALVMQMLEKDPDDRPESAEVLAGLFEAKLATLPEPESKPEPAPLPVGPRPKRARTDTATSPRLPLAQAGTSLASGDQAEPQAHHPSATLQTRPAPKARPSANVSGPSTSPAAASSPDLDDTRIGQDHALDETAIVSPVRAATPPHATAHSPSLAHSSTSAAPQPEAVPRASERPAGPGQLGARSNGRYAPAGQFQPVRPTNPRPPATAPPAPRDPALNPLPRVPTPKPAPQPTRATGWQRLLDRLNQGEGLVRSRGQRLLVLAFVLIVAAVVGLMCWVVSRAAGPERAEGKTVTVFTESRGELPSFRVATVGPWVRVVPSPASALADEPPTIESGRYVAAGTRTTHQPSTKLALRRGAAWNLTARY